MQLLHILDGYGYIFRAFYGLAGGGGSRGVRLTTSGGMPSGALYVYARMLIRLYKDLRPERIAVVFDAPGRTFRDDLDDQYKATRRETPDDLKVQMPYFRPLTEAFCWPVLSVGGVEADDVIATLAGQARERGWDVVIHSADKDLMQLVDDHVTVVDSLRQVTYDAARVSEKFGVAPAQLADWLALVGDKSDNVPGMAGIGKVTASKLLGQFGTIPGILANVDSLKGKQKERFSDPDLVRQLELSRTLVALKTDVDVGAGLDDLVPLPFDGARLREQFEELEFQALLASMDVTYDGGATASGTADEPAAVEPGQPPVAISAADELASILAAAKAANRFAIQVESDGQRPDRSQVVGFALAVEGHAPVYVPVAHRYLSVPPQLAAPDVPPALAALLSDPSVEVVCHDAKTARRVLERFGLELRGVTCDTMLAAYLLDAASDLEHVAARFAATKIASRKTLLGKGKSAIDYETLAVQEATAYAGGAAAAVLRAATQLDRQLENAGLTDLMTELELPLAARLAELEDVGIIVDTAYLRELSVRIAAQIADLERRIFKLAGVDLNIGSPKQLSALLFDTLGLRSAKMKKTKTGYSTDHEVLESLRDEHAIIAPILEHRELVKLRGTYIDALPPLVNPATGRLHTSFNQAVAATGRLSSQDPNLQNIPIRSELGREIRRAFVAAPGKVLVSADYSQIELRILAHLSGDPVLVSAFKEGIDVHTQTAAEVFGIPLGEVGAHERRVAKAVNYGLAYGQSDFGLSRSLDIPRSEAKHYIDTYFERFARVREFMAELVTSAQKTGVATTILGRRRPIADIGAKNYTRRQAAQRIAQNTPMQGSGADIMKLAMLKVADLLDACELDAQMLLTVHDELVFEVVRDQASELADAVVQTMESAYELSVPLVVDVGIADSWADAH